MQEQYLAAYQVFLEHWDWYQAQEKDMLRRPHTIYAYNRSKPLGQRRGFLNQWAEQEGYPPLA